MKQMYVIVWKCR